MCGGTDLQATDLPATDGLSPRVRGNLKADCDTFLNGRSIPACAGEPWGMVCNAAIATVYPRVCGGTADIESGIRQTPGLSPRVRGNHRKRVLPRLCAGSIPACAGEPPPDVGREAISEVYPRVCGGTRYSVRRLQQHVGLSPRVRGNLWGTVGILSAPGSIPACAGEPFRLLGWLVRPTVYPRVCGGTLFMLPRWDAALGLSPRVRGNRFLPVGLSEIIRSIPACAGEPGSQPPPH